MMGAWPPGTESLPGTRRAEKRDMMPAVRSRIKREKSAGVLRGAEGAAYLLRGAPCGRGCKRQLTPQP